MFWRQSVVTVSHIETILGKEYFELEELLDEEDILQECKAQNKKLIEFLIQPTTLDKMINLIINEPDEQVVKIRYKYANIACELLTFDVDSITDTLISQETLLSKLYSFLETEMPLNPLLSSFFCKTMCMLLTKKNEKLMEFLNSKGNFVDLMLRHIEISAIANLLLKFLTFSTMWSGILKWLNDQNVIQRLVSLINPTLSRDVNDNAAQLLCDTIKISREHMSIMQEDAVPNPLLETIESVDVVSNLLNNVFSEKRNESVIVNGISVLLTLLEFKKYGSIGSQPLFASFQVLNHGLQPNNALKTLVSVSPCNEGPEQMTALDAERLSLGINNTLEAIIPHLYHIHETLIDPPTKSPITLTTGILDPPLGQSRLEIARLIVVILSTNTHIINMQLAKFGTIFVILDLFFKYKWNNFLHTQVELIIKRIIMNSPTVNEDGSKVHPLLDQMLADYQITHKILESFSGQDHPEANKNGYMGHLTKISNHIAQALDNGVNSLFIENILKDSSDSHYEDWKEFIDNALADINAKNNTPLLIDIISSNSSDPFAFNDKFGENDEVLPDHLNLPGDISFSNEANIFQRQVNLEDSIFQRSTDFEDNIFQKGAELFEQFCQEKCHTLSPTEEGGDSDEDVWVKEEKEIPFITQNCNLDEDSSDSDEERENQEHNDSDTSNLPNTVKDYETRNMDVESQENWTTNFEICTDVNKCNIHVPMDVTPVNVSNLWESVVGPSSTSGEQENWADFSKFANFSTSSSECVLEVNSTPTASAVAMDVTDVSNSKLVSDNEITSTSDIGIVSESVTLPPENSSKKNFDTTVNENFISTTNSDDCNTQASDVFPSTDDNSDLKLSLTNKSEKQELEQNSDSSQPEADITGKPTSAIVQNGPV